MKINLKYTDRIGGPGDLSLASRMEIYGGVILCKDPAPAGEAVGLMVSSWNVPDDRVKACVEELKGFQNVEYEVEEKYDAQEERESGKSYARVETRETSLGEQARTESEEPEASDSDRTKRATPKRRSW